MRNLRAVLRLEYREAFRFVTVNLQKNKNGLIELKMEQNLLIFNLIWTQMKIGAQHLTPAAAEGTQAALETPKRNVDGPDSLIVNNQSSL